MGCGTHWSAKNLLLISLCAIVYFFAAKWGLQIGAVNVFAALVWPATGLSLVALLLFGHRVWPGIAIGAFLINWSLGASIPLAIGIATGNTLEALLGAYFLRRVHFHTAMDRTHDVFALVFLAAFMSTYVSAVVGVGSLYFAGRLPWTDTYPTFIAWWFGDMLGDLLIAPLLLVWSQTPFFTKVPLRRLFEISLLLMIVGVGSFLIFSYTHIDLQMFPQPHPYLIFPLIMLVAVQLNQRWTVTAILLVAVAVITITRTGQGPFWTGSINESLLEAQIFLAVLAMSEMVLAATVMERKMRETEARDAVQARDEFLSIASHELKTPLTSLFLQLQLFNRSLKKSLEKNAADGHVSLPISATKNAFASEETARKIASLLNDLLDLTRLRLGKLKLEKENVDLCALVKDVVERFRGEISEAGIPINVECRSPAAGFWDRVRLEQVITNLISNALKYGEGKPISIVVDGSETRGRVRLTVQDRGMGIPKDLKEKIFERFERGRIRGNQISGLGLGLYICRQIVEAHGGRVGVESELGKGSTFYVEL